LDQGQAAAHVGFGAEAAQAQFGADVGGGGIEVLDAPPFGFGAGAGFVAGGEDSGRDQAAGGSGAFDA
jgi:hypothetical protein